MSTHPSRFCRCDLTESPGPGKWGPATHSWAAQREAGRPPVPIMISQGADAATKPQPRADPTCTSGDPPWCHRLMLTLGSAATGPVCLDTSEHPCLQARDKSR